MHPGSMCALLKHVATMNERQTDRSWHVKVKAASRQPQSSALRSMLRALRHIMPLPSCTHVSREIAVVSKLNTVNIKSGA